MGFKISAISVLSTLVMLAPSTQSSNAEPGSFCSITIGHEAAPICAANPAQLAAVRSTEHQGASTQFLIARLYDNKDYDATAGYLNVYAASNCTASTTNVDFQLTDLGSFNGRVSSFKTYGLCATRLWTSTYFNGAAYPGTSSFQINSSYVGNSMNDRARSAQFS